VSRKSSARTRKFLFGFFLVFVALCVYLTGCGKIKSAFQSLFHKNHPTKTAAPPAAPAQPHVSHPVHPSVNGPRLAIILDDVAGDSGSADAVFALHFPLTLSILPDHPHSSEIAQQAHRNGYQVMLHLPMESLANERAEVQELRPGMSSDDISKLLDSMLSSVPYAAGVNNHQGSRATSDAKLMGELMPLLRARKLFFIDSRTTAATVAYQAAQNAGVPCAFRNVPFLDDVQDANAIRRQLEIAVKDAREKGQAIAIGHPHPATLRALSEFLPQAEAQGIHLVHVSELVH
jgi:uncharacterized protein